MIPTSDIWHKFGMQCGIAHLAHQFPAGEIRNSVLVYPFFAAKRAISPATSGFPPAGRANSRRRYQIPATASPEFVYSILLVSPVDSVHSNRPY